MSDSLQPHELGPTRLLHPWDFPGKDTGVGCHFLLQEIFLTQGLNLGLPHCRQTLYHLSQLGGRKHPHGHKSETSQTQIVVSEHRLWAPIMERTVENLKIKTIKEEIFILTSLRMYRNKLLLVN